MNPEKKFNLLVVLAAVFLSIFFAILIFGAIIPGEYVFAGAPWYVWAAIGDILAFIISVCIAFGIILQKDKQAKEQSNK
jgi:uncharacterized membrane protein